MGLYRARAMFEVNLFGLVGLTQLVIRPMRERSRGRIMNLSSIAGRFVTPGAGWFGASKHALEGISDALRLEVAPVRRAGGSGGARPEPHRFRGRFG